jgi:hypothetical protein
MSSFHDDDGMEALRAHCQQIEASQSANKSSNPTSDGSQWFDSQEPLKAIERDDTEAWKRLQVGISLRKIHWDINGKVCTWIDSLTFLTAVSIPRVYK